MTVSLPTFIIEPKYTYKNEAPTTVDASFLGFYQYYVYVPNILVR